MAVVVVVVAVIGVLAADGLLTPKSIGRTEAYATLSEAESVAGPAASRAASGTWSAVIAAGLRTSSSFSVPVVNLSSLSGVTGNCSLDAAPGGLTSVAVNGTPAWAGSGHAAFWLIGLSNGSGGYLVVVVDLGAASVLGSLVGPGCSSLLGWIAPFPASGPDSPAILAAANASGGSSFLGAHPGATQFWAGVGGTTVFGITSAPVWEVVDTSCPVPLLVNESGAVFNATLLGTDVLNESSGTVNCAAGLGLPPGVALSSSPPLGLAKAI